ncbi:hypothetical protein [Halalkalibacter flavus]
MESLARFYKQAFLALSENDKQAITDELPEVIDESIEEKYEEFLAD